MAQVKRIYVVNGRLVEAANKSQAVNHVARATISAEVATQSQLVALIKEGVEVEQASPCAEQLELPIGGSPASGE